jgi:hypothetical protein
MPLESNALPLVGWDITHAIMPCVQDVKILGIQYHSTTTKTVQNTWTNLTNRIKALAHEKYLCELCTQQRVRFVHMYLLSWLWYNGKILPITSTAVRQLNSSISWFLWQGYIFRLPLSNLCLATAEGGAEFIDPNAKCYTLFLSRCMVHRSYPASISDQWLKLLLRRLHIGNPPNLRVIPRCYAYFRFLIQELCYLSSNVWTATCRPLRLLLYRYLRLISVPLRSLRNMSKHPA